MAVMQAWQIVIAACCRVYNECQLWAECPDHKQLQDHMLLPSMRLFYLLPFTKNKLQKNGCLWCISLQGVSHSHCRILSPFTFTLLNPVPSQNWMVAYLGYTLRMKPLFCGWPVMVHDMHTRRRSLQEPGKQQHLAFATSCNWQNWNCVTFFYFLSVVCLQLHYVLNEYEWMNVTDRWTCCLQLSHALAQWSVTVSKISLHISLFTHIFNFSGQFLLN